MSSDPKGPMNLRGDCSWKVVYASLAEAEEAYWRTPETKPKHGSLLPYWCDEHSGFHLGHWTSHGQRARHFWGTEIYNRINRYYRVHRLSVGRKWNMAFTVLAPDPHRFDSDNDGVGCES
jgi:hypothetical protein